MTLGGGESITQCSDHDNDWCCNGDAQHVNCCKQSPSPRPFFALRDGKAYATIGSNQASSNPTLSTITGMASSAASSGPTSRASATASASRSATDPPASGGTPWTSVQTSLSSGTGGIQTVVITTLVTPTSLPNQGSSQSEDKSSSKIGIILGCALGVPLALALGGIVFCIFRKRRQQNAHPYKETPDSSANGSISPAFAGGAAAGMGKNQTYRHSRPNTTEIDSHPIGPARPISAIQGRAELESGTVFQPGHGSPYAPDTVGLGGGNGHNRSTWESGPPRYSPAANHTGFTHHRNTSELDGRAVLPAIDEKAERQHAYSAYQPPQSPQSIAELPTVKTPPEDLEKQLHR